MYLQKDLYETSNVGNNFDALMKKQSLALLMINNQITCTSRKFEDLAISRNTQKISELNTDRLQTILISKDYIGSQRSLGSFFLEDDPPFFLYGYIINLCLEPADVEFATGRVGAMQRVISVLISVSCPTIFSDKFWILANLLF
jgi:hypothetical protein